MNITGNKIEWNSATLMVENSLGENGDPSELQFLKFLRFVVAGFKKEPATIHIYSGKNSDNNASRIYDAYIIMIYYRQNPGTDLIISLRKYTDVLEAARYLINLPDLKLILGSGMYYENRSK